MHICVACAATSGSVTANGESAEHFHDVGPVVITFTPQDGESQMFCAATVEEMPTDPSALHGENGVDTTIQVR